MEEVEEEGEDIFAGEVGNVTLVANVREPTHGEEDDTLLTVVFDDDLNKPTKEQATVDVEKEEEEEGVEKMDIDWKGDFVSIIRRDAEDLHCSILFFLMIQLCTLKKHVLMHQLGKSTFFGHFFLLACTKKKLSLKITYR